MQIYEFISNIIIEFGEIYPGEVKKNSFLLKKLPKFEFNEYKIQKLDTFNSEIFVINLKDVENHILCEITYCPTISDREYKCEIIILVDNYKCQISLRGKCLYIEVSTTSSITLHCENLKQSFQCIKIENVSKINCYYSFFYEDSAEQVFSIDKPVGEICSKNRISICVKFSPKSFGYFSGRFICLVLYSNPLFINVIGVSSGKGLHLETDVTRSLTTMLTFDDIFVDLHQKINFHVQNEYLEFDAESNITKSITVTNSSKKNDVEIYWFKSNAFNLNKIYCKLPPQSSDIFHCRYNPQSNKSMHSEIITGQLIKNKLNKVYLEPLKILSVGISMKFVLGWYPNFIIKPNNILLPLAISNVNVFTTFMLRNLSHLPMTFKLIRPSNSSFSIKPMIGKINPMSFKIFCIQFYTSIDSDYEEYHERWSLICNGQLQEFQFLKMKSIVEKPCILINESKDCTVDFGNVRLGNSARNKFIIENNSNHIIIFKFDCFQYLECLKIQNKNNILEPKQKTIIECILQNNYLIKYLNEFQIVFKYWPSLQTKSNITIYESCIRICFKIITENLTVDTDSLDFGNMLLKQENTLSFYLINNTEVTKPFRLYCRKDENNELKDDLFVCLIPTNGFVNVRQKLKINVCLTAQEIGFKKMEIVSEIDSDDSNDKRFLHLIDMSYVGIRPHIQITDLICYNKDPLFSIKSLFWDLLEINKINLILKYKNNESIYISFPNFHEEDTIIDLRLLIENLTILPINYNLKFIKHCDCLTNDCFHSTVLKLETKQKYFNWAELLIKINLRIACNELVTYELNISNSLIYFFKFELNIYKETELKIGFLNKQCELMKYQKNPIQAFWIYNSHSIKSFQYTMFYINSLIRIKPYEKPIYFKDGSIVQFLNSNGTIPPKTLYPLCFQFYSKYNIHFTDIDYMNYVIVLNDIKQKVHFNYVEKYSVPLISCLLSENIMKPLLLIQDDLKVNMKCHNTKYVVIVAKNNTNNKLHLKWNRFLIDKIVNIRIINNSLLLEKYERKLILIEINSLKYPCKISVNMCCKFSTNNIDYSYQFVKISLDIINEYKIISFNSKKLQSNSNSHNLFNQSTIDVNQEFI